MDKTFNWGIIGTGGIANAFANDLKYLDDHHVTAVVSRAKNNATKSSNPSKVIGIQFSILSPEEIRKGSVAEITNRDTYINNKPGASVIFE